MRSLTSLGLRIGLCLLLLGAGSGFGGSAVARTLQIVALGDSLTAGFLLPTADSFPARLEASLKAQGIDAQVANAGVSGDTTAGGLARLDWSLAGKPDLVIVELGANDGLRGIDPKAVRANLDAIITRIQARGAKVLLTGMYPLANWGEDYQREFVRIYPELARAHGVALYPFFLDGVVRNPELNQMDDLHPNAQGVAVIVARILPYVVRLIGGQS